MKQIKQHDLTLTCLIMIDELKLLAINFQDLHHHWQHQLRLNFHQLAATPALEQNYHWTQHYLELEKTYLKCLFVIE